MNTVLTSQSGNYVQPTTVRYAPAEKPQKKSAIKCGGCGCGVPADEVLYWPNDGSLPPDAFPYQYKKHSAPPPPTQHVRIPPPMVPQQYEMLPEEQYMSPEAYDPNQQMWDNQQGYPEQGYGEQGYGEQGYGEQGYPTEEGYTEGYGQEAYDQPQEGFEDPGWAPQE
eukprot:NODE_1175_length_1062_cov_152.103653_g898_i0.p3 GENE.NODE_1175_length_1062_cov_152.103653_g898_i0~~NODE_1175_length_1062_cov_152.103653_g898_i0.p3  ORF type:complete len:167 (-),score=39.89 NODE_1175_length_1062_cov_152.103653_g898_i0:173-673(-)